jgi:predicted nucleic acid-binding protein
VPDYFFDTSALVKAYIAETGTAWVRTILDDPQNRIWISALTKVEVIAGLTRRFRVGDLTRRQLNQTSGDALQDCTDFLAVPVLTTILDHAIVLAERHNLRAYDAIQLSTAMEARDALLTNSTSPIDFIVVSADVELNQAAQLEGIRVEDPNRH